MALNAADFAYVRAIVREQAAIVLEPGKEYLVESRLLTVARETGMAVEDLLRRLRGEDRNSRLHRDVIEAMTTKETTFFRDKHPFVALRNSLLPRLIERRSKRRTLRFWCAACSSGQEPYSVALVILEYFPAIVDWNISIVGTDISTKSIERARAGCYSQLEVDRGLPAEMLLKHFRHSGSQWQLKEHVRRLVEFRELNLIGDWTGMLGMDVVFLRNVLIYFDVETKKTILHGIKRIMKPDGYLFLGGSETTLGIDDAYVAPPFDAVGCYVLR